MTDTLIAGLQVGVSARGGLLGLGYAHTMLPAERPKARALAARAEHWLPAMILAAKRTNDPAEELATLRARQHLRMERALTAGIDYRAILRLDLDSPFAHPSEFDRALCLAIERRRSIRGKHSKRKVKR